MAEICENTCLCKCTDTTPWQQFVANLLLQASAMYLWLAILNMHLHCTQVCLYHKMFKELYTACCTVYHNCIKHFRTQCSWSTELYELRTVITITMNFNQKQFLRLVQHNVQKSSCTIQVSPAWPIHLYMYVYNHSVLLSTRQPRPICEGLVLRLYKVWLPCISRACFSRAGKIKFCNHLIQNV